MRKNLIAGTNDFGRVESEHGYDAVLGAQIASDFMSSVVRDELCIRDLTEFGLVGT
jgi:hypothetical protein